MISSRFPLLFLVACVIGASGRADEFHSLFNGKDLDGWAVEGDKEFKLDGKPMPVWSVKDGLLVCAGKGYGFLRCKEEFSDFVLHLEYRMAAKGNSGIGIRAVPFANTVETRPSRASYEVQLLDDAGKPPTKSGSASLYQHVAPKVNAVKPAGEWNALDIECVGPRIKITVNGQLGIDVDQSTVKEMKDKPLKGYISLQNHGHDPVFSKMAEDMQNSRLEFRNIRVREISTGSGK